MKKVTTKVIMDTMVIAKVMKVAMVIMKVAMSNMKVAMTIMKVAMANMKVMKVIMANTEVKERSPIIMVTEMMTMVMVVEDTGLLEVETEGGGCTRGGTGKGNHGTLGESQLTVNYKIY